MPSKKINSYIPYILITCFGLIVYAWFFSPALYYDDWQNLAGRYYAGLSTWINPDFSRPFRETSWKLLFSLFGFNPGLMMAADITIKIITGFALYQLFKEVMPSRAYMATPFVLLTMVYPADKTRLWLVIINLGWTVSIMIALILYRYAKSGKVWMLFVYLAGTLFVYLEYEGPLGILTAWSAILLIVFFPRFNKRNGLKITWKRWLGLWLPIVLFIIYIFYRLIWVDLIGIGGFHQVKNTGVMPIITNLFAGYHTLLWAWFEPLNKWFAWSRLSWIVGSCAVLVFFGTYLSQKLSGRLSNNKDSDTINMTEKRNELNISFLCIVCGLILIAGGYFPFITYSKPDVEFFSSRFNAYALVGASLSIVGILDLISRLFSQSKQQTKVYFQLLIFPLILFGSACEMNIQYQTQKLWLEYRQMWTGIFQVAPGIKDGSSVVLLIENTPCKPEEYGEKPLFYANMANWELNNTFNIFYGTHRIQADYVYKGCDLPYQVRFRGEGFQNPPSYEGIIPYSDSIILKVDRLNKVVSIVEDLYESTGFENEEYQPNRLILSTPEGDTMRYILQ